MTDYRHVKRILDVVGAAGALVVLSPVLVGTALLVRKNLGSPVLFKQDRPGADGKVFRLHKFRTMKGMDQDAGLVTDEQRITEFGKKLRSTSLDELPSLINVLKGDMSFVGPRPLLVSYLERYTPEQARRHQVRPGITGLAQVSGRNLLGWDDRFALDVEYVNTMSLATDVRILVKTVMAVFNRRGIAAEGHVTMREFEGQPETGAATPLAAPASQDSGA
ncbi:sugar transferase [Citricoccus zhacaiensis]